MVKSLAFRIIFLAGLILVLPLSLHTIILYRQEYHSKIHDLFQVLERVAVQKKILIESVVQDQKEVLGLVVERITNHPHLNFSSFSQDYGEINTRYPLFYIEKNRGQEWVIAASSDKEKIQKNFPFPGKEAFIGENGFLYVSKRVAGKGYLIAEIPLISFMKGLQGMDLIFLDALGKIAASSYSPFLEKEPSLKPLKIRDAAFEFSLQGKRHFALQFPLEEGSFILSCREDAMGSFTLSSEKIHILTFAFVLFFIGLPLTIYLSFLAAKPLRALFKVMQKVRKRDFKARYHPSLWGFEINRVGKDMNQMIDALLAYQKEVVEERVAKERYHQELKVGFQIQRTLLNVDSVKRKDFEAFFKHIPALEVSGDFFDLLFIEKKKVAIMIADTAGKGVGACLFSLSLRSLLRAGLISQDLVQTLSNVNPLYIADAKDTGMFTTLWVGIFDLQTGCLRYVNAGHFPPLLVRKGEVKELQGIDGAIGIGDSFIEREIMLEEGDELFLYSDGVVEMRGEKGEMYGKKRLFPQILGEHEELEEKLELLFKDTENFRKGAREDDYTLVALGIKKIG